MNKKKQIGGADHVKGDAAKILDWPDRAGMVKNSLFLSLSM